MIVASFILDNVSEGIDLVDVRGGGDDVVAVTHLRAKEGVPAAN
jgi:hypothetical protein